MEDCQGQRDEGRTEGGSLQHVVNPKQKTGESLFIERFKCVCVCLCVVLMVGGGIELVRVSTHSECSLGAATC